MDQESSQRQKIVASFFDLLAKNEAEAAIEIIFSDMSAWIPKESTVQMRQQISSLDEYLGDFIGYEHLGDIKVAKRYVLSNYFCYYERQPILYEFTFYRPDTTWRVQNLNFKTEFESLIARASME